MLSFIWNDPLTWGMGMRRVAAGWIRESSFGGVNVLAASTLFGPPGEDATCTVSGAVTEIHSKRASSAQVYRASSY